MMLEPSSAPEGVDPEVEPEGDSEGGPDIDELFDRPDAASMEGAIDKFRKAQDTRQAHLRDGSQSKFGGLRQSLCMAGAGHDAQPAKERNACED